MPAGRPRIPTAIKLLEGNRGHRKITQEPEPMKGIPEAPCYFNDKERNVWEFVAQELNGFGLAYHLDSSMLEGFVVNYVRALQADDVIRLNGLTYEMPTKQGFMIAQRPEVSISQQCWKAAKSFAQEFGMTLASRGKLAIGNLKEIDPLEELLDQ
jgi:P27 family predicted phage terminase small subunit